MRASDCREPVCPPLSGSHRHPGKRALRGNPPRRADLGNHRNCDQGCRDLVRSATVDPAGHHRATIPLFRWWRDPAVGRIASGVW